MNNQNFTYALLLSSLIVNNTGCINSSGLSSDVFSVAENNSSSAVGDNGTSGTEDSGSGGPGGTITGPIPDSISNSVDSSKLIPGDRRIDWSSAGIVQPDGTKGIPNRTIICSTIDAATYGTGTVDASVVINAAIANCPSGQVVFLPKGQYRIDSLINFGTKSGVTLRGAGPSNTILAGANPVDFSSPGVVNIGSINWLTLDQFFSLPKPISAGYKLHSDKVTVSDITGFQKGYMALLLQDNDPGVNPNDPVVWSHEGSTIQMRQLVLVTNVDTVNKVVSFSPPIMSPSSSPIHPRIHPLSLMARDSGVEDLRIIHQTKGAANSINFIQTYSCWIKNVESLNVPSNHFNLERTLNNEVRDSLTDGSVSNGANQGVGVRLYSTTTANKIENNIFRRNFPSIMLYISSVGNYLAYNYSYDVQSGSTLIGGDFNENHNGHNMMNLWEGNIGSTFQSDGYHGSSSHGTVFRNHFTGSHPTLTLNRKAISLERYSYYYNVVGNVLGVAGWPGVYEIETNNFSYSIATIFRLGYPGMANNGFVGMTLPDGFDPKVKATILRSDNFDYKRNLIDFENGVAHKTLPASLHYSAKPAWWPTNVVWPPIGPEVLNKVNKIPAQLRFEAQSN